MSQQAGEKNRNLRLERGGFYAKRTVQDIELEAWLDRELGDWFVECVGADGTVPSDGVSDCRRGKQHPGRVIGRRIREMVIAGTADEKLDKLPFIYRRYMQRCREVLRRMPSTMPNRAA